MQRRTDTRVRGGGKGASLLFSSPDDISAFCLDSCHSPLTALTSELNQPALLVLLQSSPGSRSRSYIIASL